MHYIQKHILDRLRESELVRYTQLNPGNIESGHFRYHMRQLVQDGYVTQIDRGLYALSKDGQKLVDKLSGGKIKAHAMPKIITYTLLRHNNAVLLYKKPKQPYMGLLNMVGGKIHEGETTQQASIREVKEKTGLDIKEPRLAGVFEIFIKKDEEIFTHVIAYTYDADIDEHKDLVPISELHNLPNLAPDLLPVFNLVNKSPNIKTETIEVEY